MFHRKGTKKSNSNLRVFLLLKRIGIYFFLLLQICHRYFSLPFFSTFATRFMDKIRFLSFGSGSSGNCYFVGNAEYGFFVDAGISPRKVKAELKKYQIPLKNILGVFVTHSHYDHTKYVGSWGEKYNIPIFSTEKVHLAIENNSLISYKLSTSKKYIAHSEKNVIKDFSIECFHVPHDTQDCVGYSFQLRNKRLTLITDLGVVCDLAKEQIRRANYLVLESNYDEMMLRNGVYSASLKRRVLSNLGHLSNAQAAKGLAENWHDNLEAVFLCHLSGENNTPALAYETILDELNRNNIQPKLLLPLERKTPSELYVFE